MGDMGASYDCAAWGNVEGDTLVVVDELDCHKVHKCGLRKGVVRSAGLSRSWGSSQDSMHVHFVRGRRVDQNHFLLDTAGNELLKTLDNEDD